MNTVSAEDTPVADTGVPFELEAHRVFVNVIIGDSEPLRLFLDTGLTYPGIFLFHRERIEELDLPERIDVLVPGAGDEEPSRAVMADSVDLRLGDTVLPLQMVVISLSERTQSFPSEGIIGGTLFKDFSVEVDYASMRLRLHKPDAFSPDSSWTVLPIELRRGIPWLETSVSVAGEDGQPLRTYIDLADEFPLSLLTGSDRCFSVPADGEAVYLGTGLSGDIHGTIGQVTRLQIGPFTLKQVRTAFAPAKTRSKQSGGRLLLKPNDRFGDPFN
jgi:hypothetical protein